MERSALFQETVTRRLFFFKTTKRSMRSLHSSCPLLLSPPRTLQALIKKLFQRVSYPLRREKEREKKKRERS